MKPNAPMTKRALIIEDDADIARLVQINLLDINCQTTIATDGLAGLRTAVESPFDVILLDLALPGLHGMEVCRRIREHRITTPILILSGKSAEIDKVRALDLGADDFITKPFGMPELLARTKAHLRRSAPEKEPGLAGGAAVTHLSLGNMVIDTELHRVTIDGRVTELTVKEFDLLVLLLRHPGRTFARAELLALVWGYSYVGYEHTVNSHINRLRMKIERDAAKPDYVLTVWGVGYKLNDKPLAGPN